ncbi:BlaI/MecI/CopY family transcriptional regulator [Streptomyces sp. NPDC005805]|uniref:BlaI/MecI/CopY family transcriptional regulator n=1 Tax=Streptomyces sp. NPDC005805 TaxID=3157068 RepID=UPI0033F32BE8
MRRELGELEAAVMDLVWRADAAVTTREMRELLRDRGRELAYTTVSTVLDKLSRKEFVASVPDGRAYRYYPVLSRAEYGAGIALHGLRVGGEDCFGELLPRLSPAQRRALESSLCDLGGDVDGEVS